MQWFCRQGVERAMEQARRMMPIGGVAGGLLAALFMMFHGPGLVQAAITTINPPHTPDFEAVGPNLLAQFGFSVGPAGDVNGDGYGDVVVGAPFNNQAFVYVGSANGLTTTAYYTATSPDGGGNFGFSVGGDGDIDSNGADDLVIGAYTGGGAAEGRAFVYTSTAAGLPTLAISLTGEAQDDRFGFAVHLVGDVNGDGYADVGIGAPGYDNNTGRVYLYYGNVNAISSTASYTLTGELPLDDFGNSVAGAGDINGDGVDDLAVGTSQGGTGNTGIAYVYYGDPATGIDATNVTTVTGPADSELGTSVHGAGDVNGDGYDDLIVGAPRNISSTGTIFVYLGSSSGLVTTPYFSATGELEAGSFGAAVSGEGDVNGDGFSDLLVGAYTMDAPGNEQGKAYGYAGCLGNIQSGLIFSDTGEAESDNYGRSVAVINDVNGDGLDEYLVGAFVADGPDTGGGPIFNAGKIYAYYGARGTGCEPKIVLTETVSLAGFGPLCEATRDVTVPISSSINLCYEVRNTGNLTLTHHFLNDPSLVTGLVRTPITLPPGVSYTYVLTDTALNSSSSTVTWTSTLSVTAPFGIEPKPENAVLSATATSGITVTISGPTLDQDNDGVPDNEEGAADEDNDGIPAYLDEDETPEEEPEPTPTPDPGILHLPALQK